MFLANFMFFQLFPGQNFSLALLVKYPSIYQFPVDLWLFLRVRPRVLSPVMCRDSLNIRNIRKIRKIWAAFAIHSSEYWELRRLSRAEMKKGRIPNRSMMFKKFMKNCIWKWKKFLLTFLLNSTLSGARRSLVTKIKVNHPTKIVSITPKK